MAEIPNIDRPRPAAATPSLVVQAHNRHVQGVRTAGVLRREVARQVVGGLVLQPEVVADLMGDARDAVDGIAGLIERRRLAIGE